MMLLLIILLVFSAVLNVALSVYVIRGAYNLLQFDDLFDLLERDIETTLAHLDRVNNTPLLSNQPEVLDMARNFQVIQSRVSEFLIRMEETRRKPVSTKPEAERK